MITAKKQDIDSEIIAYKRAVSEELLSKIAESVLHLKNGKSLPIGAILEYHGTESMIQSYVGTEWVLCDGRDITSSDLGVLLLGASVFVTTVKAPDYRGMIPIGINNGRSDGKQNTISPSLGLGGHLPDGIKSHTHPYGAGGGGVSAKSGGPRGGFVNGGRTTSSNGQTQNTINSIGVNFFIKINRSTF